MVNPGDRLDEVVRVPVGLAPGPHVAVEGSRLDPVDPVLRRPVPFLVGHDHAPVRVDHEAVRCPETVGDDLGRGAVGGDLEDRPVLGHAGVEVVSRALGVVEVALRVRFQAHGELVEVRRRLGVVVEGLVVVCLTVAVQVVEAGDLVAGRDEDLPAPRVHAKRLVEPGREASPGDLADLVAAESVDDPDVAHPGGDDRAAAPVQEVEAAQAHPGAIGVVERRGDRLELERSASPAEDAAFGRDRLGPLCGAAAGQWFEIDGRGNSCRAGQEAGVRSTAPPDHDLETDGFVAGRNAEAKVVAVALDPLNGCRRSDQGGDGGAALFASGRVIRARLAEARGLAVGPGPSVLLVRDLDEEIRVSRPQVQGAAEQPAAFRAAEFQDFRVAHLVVQHDPVPVQVVPEPARDGTILRPEAPPAAAHDARVPEVVAGPGPARRVRIREDEVAHDRRLDDVPAVVVDRVPVHEAGPGPARGPAQGVRVEEQELRPLGDAARALVNADANALVRVVAVLDDVGVDLVRSVVHVGPGSAGEFHLCAR